MASLLLLAAAVVAIAGLAARAALGPFHMFWGHLAINSPLPLESLFWFAACGLLWVHAGQAYARQPVGPTTFPALYLAACLSLVALAFVRNLADPFLSDDYIVVSRALEAWHPRASLAAFHTAGGDGSFRPLGNLYYQAIGLLGSADPVVWHLTALSLHLVNCALAFVLAWRLWRDRMAAIVTSLTFGWHATRPEVVVWTAGNFDLLACACVLSAINVALWQPARKALWFTVSLVLVAAGILCKESAYAAPFLALGVMLCAPGAGTLRKFVMGSVGVCALLFAYRWYLFHGPGGYIDPATGTPQILSLHFLTASKALLVRIWTILLVPNNWDAGISAGTASAIVLVMAGAVWLILQTRDGAQTSTRTLPGLLLATACAVLPAVHLALIGPSALGSRILYLPSVAFALLMGSLALGARRYRAAAAVLFLVGTAGILSHNLGAWHRVALQARHTCVEASRNPAKMAGSSVPATMEGVFFFRNGFAECVASVGN